jgi:hypothetical protein
VSFPAGYLQTIDRVLRAAREWLRAHPDVQLRLVLPPSVVAVAASIEDYEKFIGRPIGDDELSREFVEHCVKADAGLTIMQFTAIVQSMTTARRPRRE